MAVVEANEDSGQDKYQIQADADALQRHQEVTSDPDRHAAAHQELQNRADSAKAAVGSSKKSMSSKVKKGLKKAFPASGSTPFEKAGKGGGTPFDKAGENE
jgi:hypothetical protein